MAKGFVLVFIILSAIPVISYASAHSLFNSAEQSIGGYRVQIATLPEFPNVGEKSQILFRVQDKDFNEIDRFTMGVRIFFNGDQIESIAPGSHRDGHWETDYVFKQSGNHIFKVDLYDVGKDGGVLTYTFNMSTQSPFGYIFFFAIMAGSIGFFTVIGYIYIPRIIKKRRAKL